MSLTYPESIQLNVGQKKVLSLEGKPTAGYEWTVKYDKEMVHLSKTYRMVKEGMPGSHAVEEFMITALKKGDSRIFFQLKREWEAKPYREVNINISITDIKEA